MGDFLEKAKALRPDISDWVVHFTKGSRAEAREALKGILAHGLENRGLCICFTESPIAHFSNLFNVFEPYGRRAMLAPFGVAVKKQWLFERQGRPVIYLREDERKYLRPEVDYLFEPYAPGELDFTWLREWRTKAERLVLSKEDTVLIFPDREEAEGVAYHFVEHWEYQGPDMEPSFEPEWDLSWRFVTLERLQKMGGRGTSDELIEGQLKDLFEATG
jgi:hypothetical protein